MRIGLFSDTYLPDINGVVSSIVTLQKELEKNGHEVFVIANHKGLLHSKREGNVLRLPGFELKWLYGYILSTPYHFSAKDDIKAMNLDLIHVHTEFGIGIFARIVAKDLGIPLVCTYHTMYEDYTHYITKGYFDKSSKKIVEYLTLFYCDKTANELIVPTKKTYDLFKQKYEVDKNIYIIPTGIEIERFYVENVDKKKVNSIKEKLKIKDGSFNIVFVGRLAKEKNVDLLLSAQKEIIKKNKNINLIIIGDGPDMEEYKGTSKKLGIDKNTFFTGKVPWEEVPLYYRIADVFATASTTETQGLTVIEAMAASVAPICIDDESFRNTVIDGLNGRIFKTEDEYIKIVLELSKDKKTLTQLQKQARLNAEVHSSKYYGESVLDVYKHAIEHKKYDNYGVIGKLVDIIKNKENDDDKNSDR